MERRNNRVRGRNEGGRQGRRGRRREKRDRIIKKTWVREEDDL